MAWSLHRDLGFPLDLVDLMLEERGVQVDRLELDRLISENQKVTLRFGRRLPADPLWVGLNQPPSWRAFV